MRRKSESVRSGKAGQCGVVQGRGSTADEASGQGKYGHVKMHEEEPVLSCSLGSQSWSLQVRPGRSRVNMEIAGGDGCGGIQAAKGGGRPGKSKTIGGALSDVLRKCGAHAQVHASQAKAANSSNGPIGPATGCLGFGWLGSGAREGNGDEVQEAGAEARAKARAKARATR